MKTMKTMKTCFALIGAASILSSTSLYADITINNPVVGGADGGGAFTATDNGGGLGTFLTFCLEKSEHITLPGTYNYTVNSGTVNGGVATGPGGIPGAFDPLSIGTAYLYSQFMQGGLGVIDATLGNAMQNAIWWLENEIPSLSADGATLIAYAQSQLGVGTDLTSAANGAYGVAALNLYSYDANGALIHNQDMLAIVPEPSTVIAGALLLLPLGISAIRIMRKNRAA